MDFAGQAMQHLGRRDNENILTALLLEAAKMLKPRNHEQMGR